MLPNGNLDFNSGIIGTPANYNGDSIQVLPDGTITYVQTMSSVEYRSYFMSTLYGTAANIYVRDLNTQCWGAASRRTSMIRRPRRGVSAAVRAWRVMALRLYQWQSQRAAGRAGGVYPE